MELASLVGLATWSVDAIFEDIFPSRMDLLKRRVQELHKSLVVEKRTKGMIIGGRWL